jgi:protease-4
MDEITPVEPEVTVHQPVQPAPAEPVTVQPPQPVQPPVQQPVPAPKPRSRKWLLAILGIVIVLAGLVAASYYLAHSDNHRGVTVIRMEGTLATGNSDGTDVAGSETIGKQLRDAADDPLVEAIVLRVNSPGGTPSSAQEIIRDLDYAKTKKPVVVSMGDIGTSAAYYISAHADRIYANPDTFTAGVGVIWEFSDISSWMHNEGYNITVVKSGSKKDMGSTARSLSEDEQIYAKKIVHDSFETFIADVTSHRAINRSDIEDGRVIRGADALAINVVDELGNLNDAIEGAKKLAESRSRSS